MRDTENEQGQYAEVSIKAMRSMIPSLRRACEHLGAYWPVLTDQRITSNIA